jgi:RNA polymerase nonessential primary-like sigma factor
MSKFYFQPLEDHSSVSSISRSPFPHHDSPTLHFPPQSQRSQNINSRDLMRLYLRDIGRIPLLTKDEEITLARQVQTAQSPQSSNFKKKNAAGFMVAGNLNLFDDLVRHQAA